MVHIIYNVNAPTKFFTQKGAGDYYGQIGSNDIYRGMRMQRGFGLQRGAGLLSTLGHAWKYLIPLAKKYVAPLAKSALSALGQEGLEAGSKYLSDLVKGQDPQEAFVEEGRQALKNLAKRAGSQLTQAGSGNRGKKKRKRSLSRLDLVGRSVLQRTGKKRNRSFGLY